VIGAALIAVPVCARHGSARAPIRPVARVRGRHDRRSARGRRSRRFVVPAGAARVAAHRWGHRGRTAVSIRGDGPRDLRSPRALARHGGVGDDCRLRARSEPCGADGQLREEHRDPTAGRAVRADGRDVCGRGGRRRRAAATRIRC
jgi:hypothetical protein